MTLFTLQAHILFYALASTIKVISTCKNKSFAFFIWFMMGKDLSERNKLLITIIIIKTSVHSDDQLMPVNLLGTKKEGGTNLFSFEAYHVFTST